MKLPVCLALTLLLLSTTSALGADFPVTNAAGLTDALAAAEMNDEDNVILLAAGTYKGNFEYRSSDARSLTVQGAAGTTRDQVILDGGGVDRVLGVYTSPGDWPDPYGVEVRGLTILNGDSSSDGHPYGGGLSISVSRGSISVLDCVVKDCVALQSGGGIYFQNSAETRVERCLLQSNSVAALHSNPGRGGGFYLGTHSGTHVVAGCIIAGNTAEDEGGGLWIGFQNSGTRNIVNNTIYGNDAPVGGGIYFYAAQVANVMNNCVTDNFPDKGGQIAFRDGYIPSRVGYNNNMGTVVGAWTESGGNLDIDPGFQNALGGDFHLHGLSKLKDKGKNDAPGQIAVDHEGNPRISDGNGDGEPVVDIGAYEIYRAVSVTIGSEVVVAGTGFGEKKPKLYLLYEKKPGKMKPAKLKVLTYTGNRLEALFKKKMPAGTYPLFCQPKGKGIPPVSLGSVRVMAPQIGEPSPDQGPVGTPVTLIGDWFGTKKPKAYLKDPGSNLRKKLKVKRLEFDPRGNYGEIDFIIPRLSPGKYVLQFENKISAVESSFVVTD